MIHGAFAGGWCLQPLARALVRRGWTTHVPDLPGHGARRLADAELARLGLAEYRADLAGLIAGLPAPPILVGHSMGAVLAQQLAMAGLARGLVLVAPAPRQGLLPQSAAEMRASQGLMSLGPLWQMAVHPNWEVAAADSLNRVPADRRRAVFDRFGPESGRALFQMFFWMLDAEAGAAVEPTRVTCPVLCLCGSDDRVVSPASARLTAGGFGAAATCHELAGCGHMLPIEVDAGRLAELIADWAARLED
ncbi:MAG: alpha/beta hydrolase [Actinomycetota bacterium]